MLRWTQDASHFLQSPSPRNRSIEPLKKASAGIVRSYVDGDLDGGRGASTRRRALRYGGSM
jgi:hypothetical protein